MNVDEGFAYVQFKQLERQGEQIQERVAQLRESQNDVIVRAILEVPKLYHSFL